ncbi:MAG TPA: OsmC family protein [Thermoplasmata archaeon]|nr:OsmC family protein [Thermoplasmata archaeon]
MPEPRAPRTHTFATAVEWTGARDVGTVDYRSYDRDHTIRAEGAPPIPGSSSPTFRGDPTRYNPEELLVAALSACHMLWYLHFCAVNGVTVVAYQDAATGTLLESADGGGRFSEVVLRPRVRIGAGNPETARSLHGPAHEKCFIASSVNFPVRVEPTIEPAPPTASGPGSR